MNWLENKKKQVLYTMKPQFLKDFKDNVLKIYRPPF